MKNGPPPFPRSTKKSRRAPAILEKIRKLHFTTKTPFMTGCRRQMYGVSPFLRATNRKLLLGARSPDSTRAPLAVTLWGRKSLLVHTTVSPATSRRSGTNSFLDAHLVSFRRRAPPLERRQCSKLRRAPGTSRATSSRGRTDHLGMIQVRGDGGADLTIRSLVLGVLCLGSEPCRSRPRPPDGRPPRDRRTPCRTRCLSGP